jgi:predicted nucleotidyltransferase component of viral defense system
VNTIARMPARERSDLFAETAERKALAEAISEKDFWVCWVLKQLFSIDAFNGRLLFKGGTSLSKIFHAINRFSEDIDLAVDYAALSRIDARGGKAMRDAVQMGIDHLALTTHNERRVLVLITEGYDTSS